MNYNKLKELLEQPLPGWEAQRKMAAYPENGRPDNRDPGPGHKEASVLICLCEDFAGYFPLIRRADRRGPHRGQISLPGGGREAGESRIETAIRETHEEIGARPDRIEAIGRLTPLYVPPSNFLVYPFVGLLKGDCRFIPDYQEVSEILHAHYTIGNIVSEKTDKLDEKIYRIPYYRLGNDIIWGATAMILSEFFHIISQSTRTESGF